MEGLDNEIITAANDVLTKKIADLKRQLAEAQADNERLREVAQRLTDTHQDSTGQWDTDALYTLQGLARAALAPSGGGGTHDIECAVTQWSGGSIQAPMPRCSCRASCANNPGGLR